MTELFFQSKNRAVAVYGYDLNGDGVEELITGWSNGKIDARSSRTGEVIFKDNLNHSVAGIVEGDYRLNGKNDLICCSVEGEGTYFNMNKHYHEKDWTNGPLEVYRPDFTVICKDFVSVYLLSPVLTVRGYNLSRQVTVRSSISGGSISTETDAIRDLFTKKQALLLELRNYEGNNQFSEVSAGDMVQQLAMVNQHVGIIPVSYPALWRHTFSFYPLQLMAPLISVLCFKSLLYEFILFSCLFFRPKHDCRQALLSTWVLKRSLYVLYLPIHVTGVSNDNGNDNCYDILAQASCNRNL